MVQAGEGIASATLHRARRQLQSIGRDGDGTSGAGCCVSTGEDVLGEVCYAFVAGAGLGGGGGSIHQKG